MKQYFTLVVYCLFTFVSHGQVRYGDQPLFSSPSGVSILKNSPSGFFVEMPLFDINKLLEEDLLNEQGMRGGFRFANKFITDIERNKDGVNYQLPDGTRVWQVGIRSRGAYSINVLFGEFNIPKGGKLFLYNSNRTHVIGAFTHENNVSGNNILPVQPVEGEEIIIEYSEPVHVAFEGKLKITEVNHDYRNIFLRAGEPEVDQNAYPCMTDAACDASINKENLRATVLLIINGTTGCTGTLINNTRNDETPYLLTATHCLNSNPSIPQNMNYYLEKSGTIVTFFNYQRSVCGSTMRGIESQTTAGSTALAVIEKKDIALLRLNETPPDYYNPYYAGWNIEPDGGPNPHTNLHHPNKTLKKSGFFSGNPVLTTSPFSFFDAQSHWKIPVWTTGATDGGSSGSPLFDASGLITGGLSGGSSMCRGENSNDEPDYFFALYKGWEYGPQDSVNIKAWLDPEYKGVTRLPGFDPFKDHPMVRLSNADYNANIPDMLIKTPVGAHGTGAFFGHNSLQETNEFAEEFSVEPESELVGAYILIPPVTGFDGIASPVKIHVYTGQNGPEIRVKSVLFNPVYTAYSTAKKDFDDYPVRMDNREGTENFVVFPGEIKVRGNFYISYEITYPSAFDFAVYNTAFGTKKKNSAWIKKVSGEWFSADKYPGYPVTTSLAIQPVIIKGKGGDQPPLENLNIVVYNRSDNILYINAEPGESGTVTIYSVMGQALLKFNFYGRQSFLITPGQRGSAGIVKVVSDKRNSALKIIF
ncbi:MAG: serine protease [Dysgonamonadaceae bacterium]|jgi:hypothetical protein|nr:serine protease [Dysgonamonadaceae bacterium]